MRLYFASGFAYMKSFDREYKLYELGVRHRLYSFFYITKSKHISSTFDQIAEKGLFKIMMDSGAFTVHKHGEKIDIVEYADWLLKNKNKLEVCVNLDVIPSNHSLVEKAAEEGWENLKYLESRELDILPVYHAGESRKWLSRMVDGYEYFGLSKTGSLLSKVQQLSWLDNCWRSLVDKRGKPIRKIHGFGITDTNIVTRFPWYSLDSSTWGMTGVFGAVLIPPRITYSKAVHGLLYVSKHSPSQRRKYAHYSSLSSLEKEMVTKYISSMGIDINDILAEDKCEVRDIVNIKFFLDMEKELSDKHAKVLQPCFWSD